MLVVVLDDLSPQASFFSSHQPFFSSATGRFQRYWRGAGVETRWQSFATSRLRVQPDGAQSKRCHENRHTRIRSSPLSERSRSSLPTLLAGESIRTIQVTHSRE